jgi:hypothetical protein
MASNPYQRPGFKDPRQSPEESASTVSSYFQNEAAKKPKTVTPYSAPAEPTGGLAPMGGGSSSSAPKSAPGGGTGFVSFGQYFGGNAPAVQAQAQKAAYGAKDMGALNTLQAPGGMEGGAFDAMLGGGATKREAAKQGQYRFQQLGQRLGEAQTQTPQEAQALTEAQRYNAYLQQGGSRGSYADLSPEDQAALRTMLGK